MRLTFPLFIIMVVFSLSACSGQQGAIKDGRKLLSEAKYKEAQAAFEKILDKEPKNAEAWDCLGYAKMMQGSTSAAVPDFDRAINFANECKKCQDSLGAYFYHRGLANYLQANYGPALSDFQKAADQKHDLGNSLAYVAVCKGTMGDDIAALSALNEALKNDPNNHFALSNRAYYNSKLGDNKSAIADFNKAISLKPDDKVSYLNRGYTYIGMGDYMTAIKDFEQALKIDPNYMGALAYMGIALTNTGRPQEAISYLDKAIKEAPDNPTLYYYRGAAKIGAGQVVEGCDDLHHAVENGDDQGMALIQQNCK